MEGSIPTRLSSSSRSPRRLARRAIPGRRSAIARAGETSGYLPVHRDRKATADHERPHLGLVPHHRRDHGASCCSTSSSSARRPHVPSMKEAGIALAFYVGSAILFGSGSGTSPAAQFAGEFYAGWLTEYSLSVDNLFIFLLIMAKFGVPEKLQQSALMVGIVIALVLRGIFIALGAAAINQFSLGLLPLRRVPHLHGGQARQGGRERRRRVRGEPLHEVGRASASRPPRSTHGDQALRHGERQALITPMFIVIIALGTTDLLFALDSIPAIYGLTKEPYLVLTANIFALMGLRQLYFLSAACSSGWSTSASAWRCCSRSSASS